MDIIHIAKNGYYSGQALITKKSVETPGMMKDSLIMLVGSIVSGAFVYIYQLAMGMVLSQEDYGTMLSLTSLFVILSVFAQAISLTTARTTSLFKSEGRLSAVKGLWQASTKATIIIGITGFLLLCGLTPFIARFMGTTSYVNMFLVIGTLLFVFLLYSDWGIMQGLQQFIPLSVSQMLWGFFRPALALLFVYFSLGLNGALLALPISYGITLLITHRALRKLSNEPTEKVKLSTFASYSGAALLAMFAITTLTNIDVVLAKHYLSALDVGNYSAISVLGRIAFQAPIGVAVAMFPKTTAAWVTADKHRRLFARAAIFTFIIVSAICLVYGLSSTRIITVLFSEKYVSMAPYLLKYSLGMSFFALFYTALIYFLSLGQTKVTIAAVFMITVQVSLIMAFHANISQLVNVMLVSGILSFVSVIPFFFWNSNRSNKSKILAELTKQVENHNFG